MPDSPIYGITYPCSSPSISLSDFFTLATDTEAAIAIVDAEATTVTHLPNARGIGSSNPAFNVEDTMTYTAFAASLVSSGITVNAAAGTFTIVTPGVYSASVRLSAPNSSLTITSQRVAVAVNGVNQVIKKFRGTNPTSAFVLSGTYQCAIFVNAGDVVTFRYLWTGTGALLNPFTATVTLDLLATP